MLSLFLFYGVGYCFPAPVASFTVPWLVKFSDSSLNCGVITMGGLNSHLGNELDSHGGGGAHQSGWYCVNLI